MYVHGMVILNLSRFQPDTTIQAVADPGGAEEPVPPLPFWIFFNFTKTEFTKIKLVF